jgi:hypothetical protein
MTFKPAIWYPIAVLLSAINLGAAGFAAAGPPQPWHVTIHAALALGFGLWAQRLHSRRGGTEAQAQGGLEALEAEVGKLRQEVGEMQERLDFAERLLAQRPDPGRVGPPR